MANEAILLVQTSIPINMTCADATGIEKGAIVKLADPRTVSLATTQNDIIGGVTAVEKIANDGVTSVAVHRSGIFKIKLSGSASAGDPLAVWGSTTYANYLYSVINTGNLSGSVIFGMALETGTDGETIMAELKPSFGAGVI